MFYAYKSWYVTAVNKKKLRDLKRANYILCSTPFYPTTAEGYDFDHVRIYVFICSLKASKLLMKCSWKHLDRPLVMTCDVTVN